jgi:hypothetical protein
MKTAFSDLSKTQSISNPISVLGFLRYECHAVPFHYQTIIIRCIPRRDETLRFLKNGHVNPSFKFILLFSAGTPGRRGRHFLSLCVFSFSVVLLLFGHFGVCKLQCIAGALGFMKSGLSTLQPHAVSRNTTKNPREFIKRLHFFRVSKAHKKSPSIKDRTV